MTNAQTIIESKIITIKKHIEVSEEVVRKEFTTYAKEKQDLCFIENGEFKNLSYTW
jgi:hypothetical protein